MAYQRKQRLGVSIRKFADRAGVDESFVRERIKGGYLTKLPDGSMDPELAKADWLPRNRRAVKKIERLAPFDGSAKHMIALAVDRFENREEIEANAGDSKASTFDEAVASGLWTSEQLIAWLRAGAPYVTAGDWRTGQGFTLNLWWVNDWRMSLRAACEMMRDDEAADYLRIWE